jgi:hypothetical protein
LVTGRWQNTLEVWRHWLKCFTIAVDTCCRVDKARCSTDTQLKKEDEYGVSGRF